MAEGIFMEQEKKENIIENDSWVLNYADQPDEKGQSSILYWF